VLDRVRGAVAVADSVYEEHTARVTVVGDRRCLEQLDGVACPAASGAGKELHGLRVCSQVECIEEGQPIRTSLVEDSLSEDREQVRRDI